MLLGNLLFQKGELDEAAIYYRAATFKYPDFRRAHEQLGYVKFRQGNFPEALGSLSQVIQLGGNKPQTYGLLGFSYLQTEQFVSAESALPLGDPARPGESRTGAWRSRRRCSSSASTARG